MAYNRTFWEDDPSTNTPINAENLNNIEEGLVDHDERIEALEESGGSGHIIVDENGNDMPARNRLQFEGAGVTDENEKTVVRIPEVPTKLSDLTNDTNFITNTVNNLTNYYKKSETYTQAEVDALISAIVTLNILVVQTLPTQDISTTTIYLVPKATAETQDAYDEYIYVNNAWEHIGSTQIDLSNYYTKAEINALLADKVDKVTGKQLSTEDFTSTLKSKLEGIQAGAEANVQSDWNQTDTTADDYIKNKPTISPFDINTATPTFTEASARANINSGETISTLFGKIKKFFTDLKDLAFIAKDGSTSKYLRGDGTWQVFPTSLPANGGTATNVSGTVAIANGGTGATTRLGAAAALGDEAVSSPNFVMGLTNYWGKYGYTSLSQLKSAMELNNVNNTADANKSVNYATSAGNADTVDGSHAWNMQTLNVNGDTHGTWLQLKCQYNFDGDELFKLVIGDGSVRGVKVDRATTAETVNNIFPSFNRMGLSLDLSGGYKDINFGKNVVIIAINAIADYGIGYNWGRVAGWTTWRIAAFGSDHALTGTYSTEIWYIDRK